MGGTTEKSLLEQANSVISELSIDISDFVQAIKDKSKKEKEIPLNVQKYIDKSSLYEPCPIIQEQENLTQEQINTAVTLAETIKQDITKDPYKFLSVNDDRTEIGVGSKDSGDGVGRVINTIYIEEPSWIKDIVDFCKKYKRSKGKEYFDIEMMMRGRLSKKKARVKAQDSSLYVLLDVSGSMEHYSYKGIPMLQIMATYIPIIAKKFEGWWVQSDGEIPRMSPLKILKNDYDGKMMLTGGGGADYVIAINTIIADSIIKYKNSEPTIVLMTDMEEQFPNPMPKNIILLTTANKKDLIPKRIEDKSFPSELKNQKVILIDFDN